MAAGAEKRKKRLDRGIKVRTEGIYALSGWKEIAYLVTPRATLILGIMLAPLLLGPYWQRVLCQTAAYALLALGFDFLAHYVGMVCLGGAFFVGVGGYLSGLLSSSCGLPLCTAIPLAAFGGAALCTLVFLPCLRMRGIYFAIVSFMIPLLTVHMITALNVFGGTEGLSGLHTFPDPWLEQYLILPGALGSLFGLRRLVNADLGLVFRAIKDNDQAVKASGIDVTRYKALALFIAGTMGCFAGAYLTHLYGWIGISLFATDFSILPIAVGVMGGAGTLAGPFAATFILVPLSEALRGFGQLRVVLYCLVLVGFIVTKPEGLLPYFQRKYHQFEYWEKV